jgi:hypothetical protein
LNELCRWLGFVRTNYVITAVFAELTLLYLPDEPPRVGILAKIAALVGAVKFTSWVSRAPQSGGGWTTGRRRPNS